MQKSWCFLTQRLSMTLFSMQCMMPRERHDMKHGRGQSTAKNMYAKIRKNKPNAYRF